MHINIISYQKNCLRPLIAIQAIVINGNGLQYTANSKNTKNALKHQPKTVW